MSAIDRLRSEWAYLTGAVRMLRRVTPVAKNKTRIWPDVAEELAERFGGRMALISDRESLTYSAYNARGNRYARWAAAHGVGKGDAVALIMPNRPEYLCIWLGVIRAGGVCALVNTNLTGPSLAHCINIVEPKHIVVDASLTERFETCRDFLDCDARIWAHGACGHGLERVDLAVEAVSDAPIPRAERPALTIDDRALFIYTSGTTGLPKAANINHYRIQSIMNGFAAATASRESDRIYVCLPLYHTSGGVLAVGIALTVGGSAVIRERFSAREFWDDVVRYECTMFQYIGELCRYLLNSPTSPNETRHKIRLANGNGLRPDIWRDFQRRFRIPHILEWYAATEGNVALFNLDGKPGAIGRIPKWLEGRFLVKVLKFDLEREEPVRGPDGLCVECAPGEVGEVVGQIVDDPAKPSQRFEGYADDEATRRKVLGDVAAKGDLWFRTGDLMRKDAQGYFYFIDRIGDTFRWKGENVSTSEVSEAITVFPGVREANVYGVAVPGREGRVGMAALVVEDDIDLSALKRHIDAQLPDYARPAFLRLTREMDVTGTFKQRKLDLVRDGFDPAATDDALYVADSAGGTFERIDAGRFQAIARGEVRL